MALSAPRKNSLSRERGYIEAKPMATGITVYQGGLAVRNAAGYVTKGSAALNLRGIGRFLESKANAGADGADTVRVEEGLFNFKNSTSGDAITIADFGKVAWIVDDEQVAKTSGSGTRSPAGIILGVDANEGVWVLMGEAVLAGFLSGRKKFVPIRVNTLVGTGVSRVLSPFAGLVTKIRTVIEGVLTTGDATLTGKIDGVAITTGVVTITQSGSAAGDKDEANPTAANYVAAGGELSLTCGGTNATATVANGVFEIDAD